MKLKFAPDHLKTHEMRSKEVRNKPYTLEYAPDHFKTKEV